MDTRTDFESALKSNPHLAHEYFTKEAPVVWSVFPAGVCDSTRMKGSGWDGPFEYKVDGESFEAYGKTALCEISMRGFLAKIADARLAKENAAQAIAPSPSSNSSKPSLDSYSKNYFEHTQGSNAAANSSGRRREKNRTIGSYLKSFLMIVIVVILYVFLRCTFSHYGVNLLINKLSPFMERRS